MLINSIDKSADGGDIVMEIVENDLKVMKMIEAYTDVSWPKISMESDLTYDLGLSSFDLMCIVSTIEDEYKLTIGTKIMNSLETVRSICNLLENKGIEI
jgi:acyl carrier protein